MNFLTSGRAVTAMYLAAEYFLMTACCLAVGAARRCCLSFSVVGAMSVGE